MSDVLTREEFVEHLRRLEMKLEDYVAREYPSRDELLEFIRFELSLRVLVAELKELSDVELAELINSTPVP